MRESADDLHGIGLSNSGRVYKSATRVMQRYTLLIATSATELQ